MFCILHIENALMITNVIGNINVCPGFTLHFSTSFSSSLISLPIYAVSVFQWKTKINIFIWNDGVCMATIYIFPLWFFMCVYVCVRVSEIIFIYICGSTERCHDLNIYVYTKTIDTCIWNVNIDKCTVWSNRDGYMFRTFHVYIFNV